MKAMQFGARYGDLFQMSYVTRDLDAAVALATGELGLPPFSKSDSSIEVLAGGRIQTLTVRAAVAVVGRNQFEIIEPQSGPIEVYTAAADLSARLLTFHHVGIAVGGDYPEWARVLTEIQASGDEIAFLYPAQPTPHDKVCFCYVDTRARLGHHTEYLWWHPSLTGQPAFPDLT
jgi:hypothetical protein